MIDSHGNIQPPFSCGRESFLYGTDQQSLYAGILDTINNELDVIVNLLSEGKKLLEDIDDETNNDEIITIVKKTNYHLFQHAIRINTLKNKLH